MVMAGPNSSTQQTAPVTACDIELAKLKVEQTKARWTGLSVIVPLLSAIVTVGVGVYTNYQTNKASFQLEVAKSIMQAPGPEEATNRAKFFAAIFPGRLPANFLATDVDAKKLGIGDSEGDDKRYFLKTMIEKDIDLRTLVASWKALFPKDNDFLNRPEVAEVLSQIPSKPGK
jgi:hypothetical protein